MKLEVTLRWIIISYLVVALSIIVAAAYSASADDFLKYVGTFFGAFAAGATALLVFWLSKKAEIEERVRKADRLRSAIWQDVWGTLPCVLEEYQFWATQGNATEPFLSDAWTVEQLTPTIFNASLSQLSEFETDEQHFLQLFHDNLRIACEKISAISKRKYVEPAVAREIADVLKVACSDGYAALARLDPAGMRRSYMVVNLGANTRWRNAAWEVDLVKMLGRQRY